MGSTKTLSKANEETSVEIGKRAVIYIRVSTTEQAVEGYSLAAQEKNGREQAARMGYEVTQVYADEGESGKSIKRRLAFQRMMADAEAEKFDLLIIWKLSRLGRNMIDVLTAAELLTKHNITLYSISEQFDVSTSTGKLMLQMLSSFSEFEKNQISENVQITMRSLVRDQKKYAGGRRLGYISGTDEDGSKQLVIQPDEAKIVQLIYARYLSGNGYRAIANYLNKQGYKTVKGNTFSTIAVKDILSNKIYAGYLEYARYVDWDTKRRKGKNSNPILVEGTHEPIIDQETYRQVQARLESESVQPKWNDQGENVLTGLIRCPECSGPMAASNVTNMLKGGIKKRIRYYSCANFRNKGAHVCHANSIRADKAETFVADRLKEIVQVPEILDALVKNLNEEIHQQTKPLEQELSVVALEKEEVASKVEKWEALLLDSPELQDSLIDRVLELKDKQKQLRKRENEILAILQNKDIKIELDDVQRIVKSIDAMLENRTKKEIKMIYRSFIEKINFDPATKDDIKITMKFNEGIIQQLNEIYRGVVSNQDTAIFVLKNSFRLVV